MMNEIRKFSFEDLIFIENEKFFVFFSNTNIQYIVHGKYVFDMLVHRHFCMENFHFSHFRLFTEDNFIVIENKMKYGFSFLERTHGKSI